jgi:hypothetical protein
MRSVQFGIWVGFAGLIATGVAHTRTAAAQVVKATTTTSTTTTTIPVKSPAPPGAPPAPAQTGMTLPGATPDLAADAADHAAMIGHFGIGYMGMRALAIDADPATGALTTTDVPVIGGRYWLNPLLGVDAGLGLKLSSGSSTTAGTTTDLQGYTAFILHGGVPLALAGSRHFSFQVVPELNLGYASSQRGGGGPDLTGFHFDMGARAGAEIQFGFIGIPELSLQAGIGAKLAYDHVKNSPATGATASVGQTFFGTTVGNNPWDIFAGNIAALYYFD